MKLSSVGGAVVIALACAGCHKDFDGLFTNTGDNSSGAGTSGKIGAPGDDNSTSGASGTSGDIAKDACVCPACDSTSCSFTCPKGCSSCVCDRFTCPAGKSCKISCGPNTSCDVACGEKAVCIVEVDEKADGTCSGDCTLTCNGDKQSCSGDRVACNTECPK